MERNNINIGEIYYMVQKDDSKVLPEITSFVYCGLTDNRDLHFFKAKGMSETNLLLRDSDLKDMLNFADLKHQLNLI